MAEGAELEAWLRLTPRTGLGAAAVRRLLAACGSPEAVWAAGPGLWREVAGAEAALVLSQMSPDVEALIERTLTWLNTAPAAQVITLGDGRYPAALLQTPDPPLMLFAQGQLALMQRPSLAIVGSRQASPQGQADARAFARHLSDSGLCVVSGLALGVDGAAHEGALEGLGGTIGVMGTGPDILYPRRHRALGQRVAQEGLLLTEMPPGTPPLPVNFPKRNRIIAGLSLGTLVVEAALQSGSLITARLASEFGREVFAIPGSIHSPVFKGCHQLIQQGAKLVQTGDDILQELRWQTALLRPVSDPSSTEAPSATPQDPVLAALGYDPLSLDALVDRTGWSAAALNAHLLTLELQGDVARLPGGCFQRVGRG